MRKTAIYIMLVFTLCWCFMACGDPQGSDTTGTDPQEQTAESAAEISDYQSARVTYLGPEGTYTQEACETFFGEEGRCIPCETVEDALEKLIKGKSDYAVIPQENTIGGAVIDYVDALIARPELSVVGEVELPISQNLLVIPGTETGDITKVYSHKQGIAQGKEWLKTNLPDAEVIEVSSTAEGARMVSEEKDPSRAAIASAGCADVYDLEILAADIQNNDDNITRFYVLTMKEPVADTSDRLAFIASGSSEDLPGLMEEIEKEGMTLVAIHDRPRRTQLGQYDYLIECSDSSYDSYSRIAETSPLSLRYLGSFPVRE